MVFCYCYCCFFYFLSSLHNAWAFNGTMMVGTASLGSFLHFWGEHLLSKSTCVFRHSNWLRSHLECSLNLPFHFLSVRKQSLTPREKSKMIAPTTDGNPDWLPHSFISTSNHSSIPEIPSFQNPFLSQNSEQCFTMWNSLFLLCLIYLLLTPEKSFSYTDVLSIVPRLPVKGQNSCQHYKFVLSHELLSVLAVGTVTSSSLLPTFRSPAELTQLKSLQYPRLSWAPMPWIVVAAFCTSNIIHGKYTLSVIQIEFCSSDSEVCPWGQHKPGSRLLTTLSSPFLPYRVPPQQAYDIQIWNDEQKIKKKYDSSLK